MLDQVEKLDGVGKFQRDQWERRDEGGDQSLLGFGTTAVIEKGDIIE